MRHLHTLEDLGWAHELSRTGDSWESWSLLDAETGGSGSFKSWRWTSRENAGLRFAELMRGRAGQLQVFHLHRVGRWVRPRGVPMSGLIQCKELWRFTSLWGNMNALTGCSPTTWPLVLEENCHTLRHLDGKQQPSRTQHWRVPCKSHASAPKHCRSENE